MAAFSGYILFITGSEPARALLSNLSASPPTFSCLTERELQSHALLSTHPGQRSPFFFFFFFVFFTAQARENGQDISLWFIISWDSEEAQETGFGGMRSKVRGDFERTSKNSAHSMKTTVNVNKGARQSFNLSGHWTLSHINGVTANVSPNNTCSVVNRMRCVYFVAHIASFISNPEPKYKPCASSSAEI